MSSLLVLTSDRSLAEALAREAPGGLHVEVVPDVEALLLRLRERAWTATLVSRSAAHVDAALIERLAAESAVGALLLSSPGASLQGALLAERVGARAALLEPVSAADLLEVRLGLKPGI